MLITKPNKLKFNFFFFFVEHFLTQCYTFPGKYVSIFIYSRNFFETMPFIKQYLNMIIYFWRLFCFWVKTVLATMAPKNNCRHVRTENLASLKHKKRRATCTQTLGHLPRSAEEFNLIKIRLLWFSRAARHHKVHPSLLWIKPVIGAAGVMKVPPRLTQTGAPFDSCWCRCR